MLRLTLALLVIALFGARTARAEQMVGAVPNGLMCRDPQSLADLTAPDGTPKVKDYGRADDPRAVEFSAHCTGVIGGERVTVVSRRRNTSIVTYDNVGQLSGTWYVPNIDFMVPTPDCIDDGAHVTLTGHIARGLQHTGEEETSPTVAYPRLELDRPVCWIGNRASRQNRFVSLTSGADLYASLMRRVGQHVTITGTVNAPDTSNQPPDPMMMFEPDVKPAP